MYFIKIMVILAASAAALVVRDGNIAHSGAAATTAAPSATMPSHCDDTYCDGTSSWCFYWAGVTAYDVSLGPIPGETRANIGPCGATSTSAENIAERIPNSLLTPAPVPTAIAQCDYSYCDGATSWCFYWAGVTAYDVSRGPVPGETQISFGSCTALSTSASTIAKSATLTTTN